MTAPDRPFAMPRPGAGIRTALLVVLAFSSAGKLAAADRHYVGVAYAQNGNAVRYREEHWLFDDRGTRTRLVLYRCSDGTAFARKWVRYGQVPWAPEYAFEDGRDGYREGVRREANGQLQVYAKRHHDAPPDTATLTSSPDTVIDAGFDDFVRGHWSQLRQPDGLRADFIVPSRLDQLTLRLRPVADGRADTASVQRLRMSLDGWLGKLAPSVELVYAVNDQRLLRFEGISNIRDANGHSQRVRIEFPPSGEQPAPSHAEVETALATPLASRCPG